MPMDFDWKTFLQQLSREILKDPDEPENIELPEEVVQAQWLGYPGATPEEIASAEARLGITLPPSYRAFLAVSNGWRHTGPFIWALWSTREVDWLRVRHQQLIDIYTQDVRTDEKPSEDCSEEEHLVYGEGQREWHFRAQYLENALEISGYGDAGLYLLNPSVVFPDGEWEAWHLASWNGASRYRSFQELMQAVYQSLLDLRKEE